MAEIVVFMAAKLIEVLMSDIIQEVCQIWNCKSQLAQLKDTVSFIHRKLLDVDAKRELSNQVQDYINKFKDVLYDADDLFDEIRTLEELKKMGKLNRSSIKIKKRLEVIVADMNKIRIDVNYQPVVNRGEETCSYVDANGIIGREEDKEKIVNMLIDPNASENVSFLSIVGVGGLGKTALAQLVFNDEKIRQEFPHRQRQWVCVCDQDRMQFDVKFILCKIIDQVLDSTLSFELVLRNSMKKLSGRKYFLVLDDVWNEDREKWLDLKRILMLGERGSRVVITTRSEKTATIIGHGDDHTYMLQGLSNDDSWRLFEMSAFTRGREEENHDQLVEIGKNIVEKCYNIPLAIKVTGSLLYGQAISEWRSFEGKISKRDKEIFRVLMPSYHNLIPSIQSCFRYCAIFPKDVRIRKEKMIGTWIAQGYVEPLYVGQSIEDAAEEYFLILLQKCFFKDVVRDEYGEVESVKIHDLMRDLAQEVGQEEICVVPSNTDRRHVLGDRIRHVHHIGDGSLDISLSTKKIRSYVGRIAPFNDIKIDNWMRLRVLDLSWCEVRSLPKSIGTLLQLRYLDLSHNYSLKVLNDSVTDLSNLQVLDLFCCNKLRELPKGISNLVNLRHLNLDECNKLTCMPIGMDMLPNLSILPLFVVGNSISREELSGEGALKDLKPLCKIRGKMCIKIGSNYRSVEEGIDNEGGYLKSMDHLREIRVEFKDDAICAYNPDVVLDNMEPPRNIKGINLQNYRGTRIGRWGRAECNWTTSLPSLVHIVIWKCGNLQQMPLLSKLPFLKTLTLFHLDSLEYMENATSSSSRAVEFFPSLETLKIMWMERLKGWWKGDGSFNDCWLSLRFPSLSYLKIYKCPDLISFAHCQIPENMTEHEFPRLSSLKIANCPQLAFNLVCPTIKTLKLRDINEKSQITVGNSQDDMKWRHVEVDKMDHLKSLNTKCLTSLCIHADSEVESLSVVEGAFQNCASSLRELEIRYCANLRDLSGLEHLTALEELKLLGNNQLSISGDEEEPWKLFHQILRLKFHTLPNMKSLPKGLQYFTSLQILELRWCENLEGLPEWMSHLSSLKSLSLFYCPRIRSLPEAMKDLRSLKNLSIQHPCPDLYGRCKNPDGEDFHKIQHIPNKFIGHTI